MEPVEIGIAREIAKDLKMILMPIVNRSCGWRLCVLALLAAFITACGGGGGSASSSTASPGSAQPTPSDPDSVDPMQPSSGGSGAGSAPATNVPSSPWVPISNDPRTLKQDALRFLNQSSFGATAQDLAHVEQVGYETYLDEQFAQPRTGYNGFTYLSTTAPANCRTDPVEKGTPENICARDHYSLYDVQRQFYANAINGKDQLRQRVAFALSQIFVVSGNEVTHAAGMATYQNMLLDQAFGNYRELLEGVARSPVMGAYLDMVNNAKGNATRNTLPNENFARECLQLFSVGIDALNLDGTVRTDAAGAPIATYDQPVVSAFARVFTGWTFAPIDGALSQWTNPSNLVVPMVAIEEQHDVGTKVLLDHVTLPAGQTAQQDLEAALDVIFEHQNVGPFMAKRLIQHLVTSNPTPAYVARIASVFNDNGVGVRGDLEAVVRAILLDAEARGLRESAADFGRLKDPSLFMTNFVRGLGGQSDGVYLRSESILMGENIFTAPSVFNYYSPTNKIRGSELLGPEFQIYDSNRALLRAEFVYQLVYGGGVAGAATVANSTGTSIDLASFESRSPDDLLNELDARLTGARLSSAARDIVHNAIYGSATSTAMSRAKMAMYLVGVSPQFQVQQ
jgi:uncharacterized protein (DUF1800 family)